MEQSDLASLSHRWNGPGRRHAADVRRRLQAFHEGRSNDPGLPSDPRGVGLADEVLAAIRWLYRQGRWREARDLFDPAHEPFIPRMGRDGITDVVAIGADEALFCAQGPSTRRHLWHVSGDVITPHGEWHRAAMAVDRSALILLGDDGLVVLDEWGGTELASHPLPTKDQRYPGWVSAELRHLYRTSDDPVLIEGIAHTRSGTTIALATEDGVLVRSQSNTGEWRLALPDPENPIPYAAEQLESGDETRFHADMVHVALSADGRFLACGTQDHGHHLIEVRDDGSTSQWATLGFQSDYPHYACFSDSQEGGPWVAFNSCHFYSGATIAARVMEVEGLDLEPYVGHDLTPVINDYLRVYAAAWLPANAPRGLGGSFALAGGSLLTMVSPSGAVRSELLFGSSAGGIDYHPESETLVLGSYSGFLHFLDLGSTDEHSLGWNPPAESRRWCFLQGEAFLW